MFEKTIHKRGTGRRFRTLLSLCGLFFAALTLDAAHNSAAAGVDDLKLTANFTDREIGRRDRIVISLDRPLQPGGERLAVFIAETDLTSLFTQESIELIYLPDRFPLPVGSSLVRVYQNDPTGAWKLLAEFTLAVRDDGGAAPRENNPEATVPDGIAATESTSEGTKYDFTPNVTLNLKGQNQTLTFPRESAPERNPFTEVDGQIGLELKINRRGWSLNNKFDFVGVGFRPNALRFGELQDSAPLIDLSSYLIELSKGRFKVNFGHVSFGSNRHLINSFSSRGISATIPVSKQNEITLAAMNGTSVVGYDNFIGVTKSKHNVLGVGFAREFFKERPNGLRVEFTVMRGSLLPLSNFNQGEVNDAETSLGFGFRVKGNDKKDRIRYEAGFTRSRFVNPTDPLLEQGQNVTPIRETWRNARFAEISVDLIRDRELWRQKKLKLVGTYRHEELEPLYRSIGVSLQADRRQNQFEISGNLGELNFAFGNLRDRDNLSDIVSILKTLNRRSNVVIGVPLGTFFTPEKPRKWLPQVSYTLDRVHQFGAFLPSEGEFRDESQVPDQKSYAHSFNAQWTFSERFSLGYRYGHAFQDNRQIGRERADFRSSVHAFTIGTKPLKVLDLDFELARERQHNLEQPRTDNTFRFSTRALWRTAFLKNSSLSSGISVTLAGDANNQSDARNAEFDIQWAYRFAFGSKKFKKLDTQFFVRYSNRYGNTIDRIFLVNGFNKTQAFNAGLTFNIF